MARRKKNDFWDDVDEEVMLDDTSEHPVSKEVLIDEEWSATKCLPIKIIMRFLLMVACLVAIGSAYIAYQYVGDRYASGSYNNDFYTSESFAKEYNKSMGQVIQLISAMEEDATVTQTGNEELLSTLVENYLGKDTNFMFLIQDKDHYLIASSSEDAKTKIESSTHYVMVSTAADQIEVTSTIANQLLNKSEWEESLAKMTNKYIIYTAVDSDLTQNDSFSQANKSFEEMAGYFGIARFVGIAAVLIFIICLIFCIMSTGMKRGYPDVCLTWFDRIFTEIAVVIMAAVAVGLFFAIRYMMGKTGNLYQYGTIALVVVSYGWIIRCYFSIVRRIKAGRLLRCSIIGTIIAGVARGINKLPSPLNIIVGGLLLIAINGGVIYGVIFLRQYTVKGIPIMFIVAPVIFVIELLALIVHKSGNDLDFEEEESGEDISDFADDLHHHELKANANAKTEEVEQSRPTAVPKALRNDDEEELGQPDWEAMDLSNAITEAEQSHTQQFAETVNIPGAASTDTFVAPARTKEVATSDHTEILSEEDIAKVLKATGVISETESQQKPAPVQDKVTEETIVQVVPRKPAVLEAEEADVNFVQLNKDVRKEFKAALKGRGVGVTVRAPEKPIHVDIDSNSMHLMITDIFKQIERLAADNNRAYIEVYLKDSKVVYIVRIPTDATKAAEAKAAIEGDGSFDNARKIVEGNDGKFVLTMDGTVIKVGMMMNAM